MSDIISLQYKTNQKTGGLKTTMADGKGAASLLTPGLTNLTLPRKNLTSSALTT
jgi:hypothetical protein